MWRVISVLATLIGIILLSVFELFRLIGVTVAMMWLLASGRWSVMRHSFASCDVGGVFPLPHDFFLDEFYLDRVLIFPRYIRPPPPLPWLPVPVTVLPPLLSYRRALGTRSAGVGPGLASRLQHFGRK